MSATEDVVVEAAEEVYIEIPAEHVMRLDDGGVAVSLSWLAEWRMMMARVEALP